MLVLFAMLIFCTNNNNSEIIFHTRYSSFGNFETGAAFTQRLYRATLLVFKNLMLQGKEKKRNFQFRLLFSFCLHFHPFAEREMGFYKQQILIVEC